MSFLDGFSALFLPKKQTENNFLKLPASSPEAVRELFSALLGVVKRTELVREVLVEYEQAARLLETRRELSLIRAYRSFEEFIVNHKPPDVDSEYSRESLRDLLKSRVKTENLGKYFRTIFLSDSEKIGHLSELAFDYISRQNRITFGTSELEEVVKKTALNPVGQGLILTSDGSLEHTQIEARVKPASVESVVTLYKDLFSTLFSQIVTTQGPGKSQTFFKDALIVLESNYPLDIIRLFLDVLPRDLFENERISMQSREELEKTVAERTRDIMEIKKVLEERVLKFEVQNKLLEDTNGAMLNLVDDARKLEQQMQIERDQFHAIVDTMGEGLLVINENHDIKLINPAAADLLGVESLRVVGRPWTEVVTAYKIDGREIPAEERSYYKVLNEKKQVETVLKDGHYYKSKAGKLFPITSVTTRLPEVGVVKVFRDATIEKQFELRISGELKQEQVQSQSVLSNMGEGVVLTNDSGKITYVNLAFEKMVGFSEGELKDKVFAETLVAYDMNDKRLAAQEMSDAAAVTANRHETKVQLESKLGKKIAVVINGTPITLDGVFKGVVRVVHDFSEDLALQRQKDDFFSIASHELRTPLTVISGNLDMVLDGYGKSVITPEDKQLLADSEEAGDRLILMVNNFLNVSRLDQGRINTKIESVRPCNVVKEVVEEMRGLVEKKGLKLTYACDNESTVVLADENLLKEIVINLIGNSVKFTESGGIDIQIRADSDWLYIKLSDTGIGIAADKQKLLFQRFQQAMERTLSREAGGTGLGLYISREFARKMGGELRLVESEMGKGTMFELTLPIVVS